MRWSRLSVNSVGAGRFSSPFQYTWGRSRQEVPENSLYAILQCSKRNDFGDYRLISHKTIQTYSRCEDQLVQGTRLEWTGAVGLSCSTVHANMQQYARYERWNCLLSTTSFISRYRAHEKFILDILGYTWCSGMMKEGVLRCWRLEVHVYGGGSCESWLTPQFRDGWRRCQTWTNNLVNRPEAVLVPSVYYSFLTIVELLFRSCVFFSVVLLGFGTSINNEQASKMRFLLSILTSLRMALSVLRYSHAWNSMRGRYTCHLIRSHGHSEEQNSFTSLFS